MSQKSEGQSLSYPRISRRRYIQASAVGVTVGIGGCAGGENQSNGTPADGETTTETNGGSSDGGQTTDLVAGIHEQGTGAYAMAQANATVVNEETKNIRLDVRPSASVRENIGKLNRGQIDIAYLGNWELSNLIEGNDPYKGVDVQPLQMYSYQNVPWLLVTNNEDVMTIEDLEGKSVGAGPEGAAVNQIMRHVANLYDVDIEFPSVPFSEMQGAFSQNIIEAATIGKVSYEITPPWVEQIKASEDLYIVEWPDNGQKLVDDSLIPSVHWEPENMSEFTRHPDEQHASWNLGFFLATRDDVQHSAISEMMNTTWENIDKIAENHALFNFLKDIDFWPSVLLEKGEIHPAAKEFYQNNDVEI